MIAKCYHITVVVLICSILYACNDALPKEDYKEWLYSSESGLSDTVQRSGRVYSFTLLPSSYRRDKGQVDDRLTGLLRVISNNESLPDASFDQITSLEGYGTRVANLAFHIKALTQLRIGSDLIDAAGSQMPMTQGLRPVISVYVVFPVSEKRVYTEGACEVVFDDEVFGEGLMTWQFNTKNLLRQVEQAAL